MAPPLSATLALASSVPMALLGVLLLVPGPRRSEQVFFGLFAVGWAGLIAATNVGLVLESASVFRAGSLVHFALLPPTYLFLAQFTSTVHGGPRTWILPGLAALVAGLAMLVLVTDPTMALASVAEAEGGGVGAVEFGEAAFPLFFVPFFGVFYLCLAALYRCYRRAPPGSSRHRYRGMLIALALYTSYQTVTNLWIFGFNPFSPASVSGPLGPALAGGLFLAGAILLAGLVVHLLARPADPGQRDPIVLAAFLVPAGVALATESLPWIPLEARSWGLWRLLMVAVLVHAIARHRLFDLDLKAKRWAAPAIAVAIVGLSGFVGTVRWLGGASLSSVSPTLLVGGLAAAGIWTSREHVGRTLFPEARDDEAYLSHRKLEVYRAALGPILEDGGDPDEEPILTGLRRDLNISREEHEALVFQLSQGTPQMDGGRLGPIEPGARVADRYVVDRLIGEGAHGRAFAAYDEHGDRTVAIKVVGKPVLGASGAQNLLREARLLSEVQHPNVIEVVEVLEGRHEIVLVTEYAAGGSLSDLLERRGRLGVTRAVEIVQATLRALEAAHAEGIVHRDVKPENILLTDDGEVRLADFGVAERSGDEGTVVDAGPAGTLLYMAPEQVRGQTVDERTDLYAVGVVLHRMLTGGFYLPIAGEDDFGIRRRILEDEPDVGGDTGPAWASELLERALAKDPGDRFASAREMREALPVEAAVAKPST